MGGPLAAYRRVWHFENNLAIINRPLMADFLVIAFAVFVLGVVLYGLAMAIRKAEIHVDPHSSRCAICGEKFKIEELVERSAAVDSRALFFCADCIRSLHRELHKADLIPPAPSRTSKPKTRRKGKV